MAGFRRLILVRVTLGVSPELLDDEDEEIEGDYFIATEESASEGEAVSVALDFFHSHVAISDLDCFYIECLDPLTGRVLFEEDAAKRSPWSVGGEFIDMG